MSAATVNGNVTNVQTAGGNAYGTMVSFNGTDYTDSIAILRGYSPDQYVQVTLANTSAPSGLEIELWLRGNVDANNVSGYEIDLVVSSGSLYIVRWNGPKNNYTILVSAITANVSLADGAVWYAEIVGTVITVKCNGTTVYTYDTAAEGSSKITSGNPGIGFWNETGSAGNQNKFAVKDFTANTL